MSEADQEPDPAEIEDDDVDQDQDFVPGDEPFDNSGILFWLGTQCGAQPWSNPCQVRSFRVCRFDLNLNRTE